ncbi:MAG TPA: DNA N-6-adenine-methyltransferase [Polyangiales bacterium]|jgi:hypothetical protein|nr:DNA N-6-adenine-methyltransferase [Polyangiales bacterium]
MNALAPVEKVSQAEALLSQAVAELEHATTLGEVLNARDVAQVVRECLELRDKGSAAHAAAWETVVLANARAGDFTRQLPKGKRGPKTSEVISPDDGEICATKTETLAALNITSQDASRFERLSEIPRDELRARIELVKQDIIAGKRPRDVTAVTSAVGHDGDQFSTPAKYVDPARKLMGGIELDPFTNPSAQLVVRADRFYTRETDGFAHSWAARSVWFQPPYSRGEIQRATVKLREELPRIAECVGLVNSDPSTDWYQSLLNASAGHCQLNHRIAFELDGTPVKGNAHPQVIFYFGPKLPAFARAFSEFGTICVVYKQGKASR